MNNITTVINQIYKNMIGIILQDIDIGYHEAISQKYMETLVKRYSDVQFDASRIQDVYNSLYGIEYKEWSTMASGIKKHVLMTDNSLNKIIDIASAAFKAAESRLNTNVIMSKELANEYIDQLKKNYEEVEDFNKDLALWYISESSADLAYASNQTESMSMRISHIKK